MGSVISELQEIMQKGNSGMNSSIQAEAELAAMESDDIDF